jgi:hypothetical protein
MIHWSRHTGTPFFVTRIFWANILSPKGHSEATTSLGDSGACEQNGRATNDNQFQICGHFHRDTMLERGHPFLGRPTAKVALVNSTNAP